MVEMACLLCNSLIGGIGIVLLIFFLGFFLLRQKPNLIFDKYPTKNWLYHIKYGIALIVLKYLRHRIYSNKEKQNSLEYLEKLDKPQELSNHPKSYDVVSFMAANEKGEKFYLSLERRKRGILKAALYISLPQMEGIFGSEKLPDMVYFTTDGNEDNKEFKGSGFHVYPEKIMNTWKIHYEGVLKRLNDGKIFKVELDLSFDSKLSYFNYNKDLSAKIIADSVAREAWNGSFYDMLHNVDKILEKRTHYEQNGRLTGSVLINNEHKIRIDMKGFRDHSFGTDRCLSTINRYVYFALFLDDGTNMVIGNLSQPSFFLSSLKVGYICTKDGEYHPITDCNFELYSYGEKGIPPKNQNFFVATENEKYFVQIKEEDATIRYVGGNWESKVYNQFISCLVNGIKGHGITEFLYRYKEGRPETVSSSDPDWYKNIRRVDRSLSNEEFVDDSEAFIF